MDLFSAGKQQEVGRPNGKEGAEGISHAETGRLHCWIIIVAVLDNA
jgi:hypothetical protein